MEFVVVGLFAAVWGGAVTKAISDSNNNVSYVSDEERDNRLEELKRIEEEARRKEEQERRRREEQEREEERQREEEYQRRRRAQQQLEKKRMEERRKIKEAQRRKREQREREENTLRWKSQVEREFDNSKNSLVYQYKNKAKKALKEQTHLTKALSNTFKESTSLINAISWNINPRNANLKSIIEKNFLNLLDNFKFEECKELEKMKILILGKTGAGKSTLINSILKLKDREGAETGRGECITKINKKYASSEIPWLELWDSRGIELNQEFDVNMFIENVKNLINEQRIGNDPNEYIHCIWFCLDTELARLNGLEKIIERLKDIYTDKNLPVILVLTKAYDDEKEEKLKNECEKHFKGKICSILAQDKRFGSQTLPGFGLKKLSEETFQMFQSAGESAYNESLRIKMKDYLLKELQLNYNYLKEYIKSRLPEINENFFKEQFVGIFSYLLTKRFYDWEVSQAINLAILNISEQLKNECQNNINNPINDCINEYGAQLGHEIDNLQSQCNSRLRINASNRNRIYSNISQNKDIKQWISYGQNEVRQVIDCPVSKNELLSQKKGELCQVFLDESFKMINKLINDLSPMMKEKMNDIIKRNSGFKFKENIRKSTIC